MVSKKTIAKGTDWELYFSFDDDDFHIYAKNKSGMKNFVRYMGRTLERTQRSYNGKRKF